MSSKLFEETKNDVPLITTTITPNVDYLKTNQILTSSEYYFLVLLGTILEKNNLINYDKTSNRYLSELELAKKVGLSRKTLSTSIQSLCNKGVLKKVRLSRSDARHKIYLNPLIMFYGADIVEVSASVRELFVTDDGSPLLDLPIQY